MTNEFISLKGFEHYITNLKKVFSLFIKIKYMLGIRKKKNFNKLPPCSIFSDYSGFELEINKIKITENYQIFVN